MKRSKPVYERLLAKTDVRSDEECWEWRGWCHPFGHGQIGRGSRKDGLAYTHVISWEHANGRRVPVGMIVRHTCDNPKCVNPKHLLLGTKKDNTHDMISRRRHRFGDSHSTKLKEADVVLILARLNLGESQQALADHFGVARSLIGLIKQGKRWSHIPRN